MTSHKPALTFMLASLMLAFTTGADAQTAVARKAAARIEAAVKKVAEACKDDLGKYCSTVTPGGGRLLFCMIAHEDKISTKCDYALYAASRNLERTLNHVARAADACWPDIEKHCANIPEGGGRIAQCLADKKTSLAKPCQAALSSMPAMN